MPKNHHANPVTKAPRRASEDTLKSMVKMLAVLECFSVGERHLKPSEIARRTQLPRATAHRIVATLREIGLLDQDRERDSYRLGLKLFELGSRVLSNMDLHREAVGHIARLQHLTGENVHLCVFNGSRMVLIERRQLETAPANMVTTMEEAPTHCTGVGKAFLAFQEIETQNRLMAEKLERYTPGTIVEPQALHAELARVRQRGYALDLEEHQAGVRCVAAPIRDVTGRVFASVSVSGPAPRMPIERLQALSTVVCEAASAVSLQLGWQP
jgi:DNA-binding IclR family transcriptional regulator